ncbi:MAG: hypothetical protein WBG17_15245 [Burkholderiaceae bacterium]
MKIGRGTNTLYSSVDEQGALEIFGIQLLGTLYNNPIAFSIRDGDGVVGQPPELRSPLERYRLECYAIEIACLTDSCLAVIGTSWKELVAILRKWIKDNPNHRDTALI